VTVALMYLPFPLLAAAWLAGSAHPAAEEVSTAFGLQPAWNLWPLVLNLIGLLLFFILLTGVGSYFFHPRRLAVLRQNRAVALSYYACAPLAPAMWCIGVECV